MAFLTLLFIINRLSSKFLKLQSPFSILYKNNPNYNDLGVLGSLVYASSFKNNRTKFDTRSIKCIFLGHKHGPKGDIIFYLHIKQIFLSIDTIFYENIFPYQSPTNTPMNLPKPTAHPYSQEDNLDYLPSSPTLHPTTTLTPHFGHNPSPTTTYHTHTVGDTTPKHHSYITFTPPAPSFNLPTQSNNIPNKKIKQTH